MDGLALVAFRSMVYFRLLHAWGHSLVIRGNNGSGVFLLSKEGITNEDPVSMFACSISILTLIRILKQKFRKVEQPWYAYNVGEGSKLGAI
jgi:hypothetical protein